MGLNDFVTLGRSGLRVGPMCLGTMTFGTERGWGVTEDIAQAIFNTYVERGGIFFDTADIYNDGTAERMLGKFVAERRMRDRAVIATKFTMSADREDPNAGGNGRKNIYRALEGSLRRLGTDYVDLYWMHAWDAITPLEEVLSTLNDLVREGKIRHFGLSDVPAWYATRLHTLAEQQGKEPLIALQLEYSLLERNIEREHIPAAQEMGWALCPWSPLAGGLLTGKYLRDSKPEAGRLVRNGGNPILMRQDTRFETIIETAAEIAKDLGVAPAQVALQWALRQPGITSLLIGATSVAQLENNLSGLDIEIPVAAFQRLQQISAPNVINPYNFSEPPGSTLIRGSHRIRAWHRALSD